MIGFLISFLVFALVLYVIWYVIGHFGTPSPIKEIIGIIFLLLLVVFALNGLGVVDLNEWPSRYRSIR